jgi:hypothetical protein
MIAAMQMTEIGDEAMTGITPIKQNNIQKEWKDFGYYTDSNGYRRFGVIPNKNKTKLQYNPNYYDDDTGTIRTSNPRIYY